MSVEVDLNMSLQDVSMIKSNEKLGFEGFDFKVIRGRIRSCTLILNSNVYVVVF